MISDDDMQRVAGLTRLQKDFLVQFSLKWDTVAAGEPLGISAYTVRQWREEKGEFLRWWDIIHEMMAEAARQEAFRRAVRGTRKPKFNRNGDEIAEEIEYSDALLARVLEKEHAKYAPVSEGPASEGGVLLVLPGNNRGEPRRVENTASRPRAALIESEI